MEYITNSAEETQELGKRIGSQIAASGGQQILALEGDLGSGKTTFVQGLAEGLGVPDRILSPTFILMRQYNIDSSRSYETFYHIDLYRLEKNVEEELKNLGFFEIIGDPNNLAAIEWAEKARNFLPDDVVLINFEYLGEDKRKITIAD